MPPDITPSSPWKDNTHITDISDRVSLVNGEKILRITLYVDMAYTHGNDAWRPGWALKEAGIPEYGTPYWEGEGLILTGLEAELVTDTYRVVQVVLEYGPPGGSLSGITPLKWRIELRGNITTDRVLADVEGYPIGCPYYIWDKHSLPDGSVIDLNDAGLFDWDIQEYVDANGESQWRTTSLINPQAQMGRDIFVPEMFVDLIFENPVALVEELDTEWLRIHQTIVNTIEVPLGPVTFPPGTLQFLTSSWSEQTMNMFTGIMSFRAGQVLLHTSGGTEYLSIDSVLTPLSTMRGRTYSSGLAFPPPSETKPSVITDGFSHHKAWYKSVVYKSGDLNVIIPPRY